jgi:uncharacterized protein (DUF3820 family)
MEYYTEMKANNNVARCLKCDTFIKNIPQGNEPTFFFGKYKGTKVKDVEDMQYLNWALKNIKLSSSMRTAIEQQINRFENIAR